MGLNERELRAVVAIADGGSVGRAAAQINMSQPALSRLLQALEARLGVRLFERSRAGMELTTFGETLLPHARLLLFEMQQAIDAIDALRGVRRGTVRIGAVATVARSILPGAIAKLLAEAPDLQVELLEAADDKLLIALEGKSIDLIIAGALPPQAEISTVVECRFNDRYLVFCSASHRLAARDDISLDELLAERWIMPPVGSTPRRLFDDAVRAAGKVPPRVAIDTVSPGAIAAVIRETDFLGWLPQPLFASEQAARLVVSLSIPELNLPRRFFVYRRSRGILPPAARRLISYLPAVS